MRDLLLASLVCVAFCAWAPYHTSTGRIVHWERDVVVIRPDSSGTADVPGLEEYDAALRAMNTWNRVQCPHPELELGDLIDGAKPGEKGGVNLLLFEDQWQHPEYSKVIALTTLYYDDTTGVAVKVDVEMNDEDFYFTVSDDPKGTSTDVQNALTHEFGHVLGLDHSTVPTATMYYSADPGDLSKRTLHKDDLTGLCTIYKSFPLVEAGQDAEAEIAEGGTSGSGGCTQAPRPRATPLTPLSILFFVAGVVIARRRSAT